MFTSKWLLGAAVAVSAGTSYAQSRVDVVRILPGWKCMALASSYGPQGAFASPAPVYAGPEPNAPQIGTGAGVIIVPERLRPINGRTEIIRPNGQKAWIEV